LWTLSSPSSFFSPSPDFFSSWRRGPDLLRSSFFFFSWRRSDSTPDGPPLSLSVTFPQFPSSPGDPRGVRALELHFPFPFQIVAEIHAGFWISPLFFFPEFPEVAFSVSVFERVGSCPLSSHSRGGHLILSFLPPFPFFSNLFSVFHVFFCTGEPSTVRFSVLSLVAERFISLFFFLILPPLSFISSFLRKRREETPLPHPSLVLSLLAWPKRWRGPFSLAFSFPGNGFRNTLFIPLLFFLFFHPFFFLLMAETGPEACWFPSFLPSEERALTNFSFFSPPSFPFD